MVDAIPLHFKCRITGRIMQDPVKMANGHTYHRPAIEDWLKEQRRSRLTMTTAVPDDALRTAINAWQHDFTFPLQVVLLTGHRVVVDARLTDDLPTLRKRISRAISVLGAGLRLFRGGRLLRGAGNLEDLRFRTNEVLVNGVFPFRMSECHPDWATSIARYFSDLIVDPTTYHLGAEVCRDGRAIVSNATDANGQPVMVKQFWNMFDPIVQRSFIRDAFIPHFFRSPGVVKVLGFAFPADPNGPGIVVAEDLPNGRLDEAVMTTLQGRFGPTELSNALFGIAATMQSIHAAGAILRNLRSWNVMLDAKYRPRIFNFQDLHFGCELPTIFGRAGPDVRDILCMAPESIDHESCSNAIDVYAYGSLVCACFGSLNRLDNGWTIRPNLALLMRNLSEGRRPMRPSEMSDPYWELVDNCWIRAPADRPTFESIVTVMASSPKELSVAGTDVEEYAAYRLEMDRLNGKVDSDRSKRRLLWIKRL